MISIPNWMFLSSFEDLRKFILGNYFLESLIHNGRGVFGSDFGSCSFVIRNFINLKKIAIFKRLFEKEGSVASNEELSQRFFHAKNYLIQPSLFKEMPGSPIAYWASSRVRNIYKDTLRIENLTISDGQNKTGNNDRFLRFWWEIRNDLIGANSNWKFYAKGGDFRRWQGNLEFVLNWSEEAKKHYKRDKVCRLIPEYLWCRKGITWGATSRQPSFRILPSEATFDVKGSSIFFEDESNIISILSFLNSKVASLLLEMLNPTISIQVRDVRDLPWLKEVIDLDITKELVTQAVGISSQDWNTYETSRDFETHFFLSNQTSSLSEIYSKWISNTELKFCSLKQLEEQNNRYWIEAYGLQDELTPEVPDAQITIRRADLTRDIKSLISYAVGCMMGRYSLDQPGLIHAGQPFDPSQHTTFPADADAILPITDQAYFDDDIVSRFVEFIKTAYGEAHLRVNLDFIAHALTLRDGESAQDRIRRYFLTEFISDHIQTYKKRPIYWLFTSGKNRAFGALVYLHRYTPNTVAQIRTDYVLELQRKLAGECDRTQKNLDTATSSPAKKAIQRRLKTLRDQDAELALYQAKLQTVADQRIHLDLDDGVAYNYTRFKGLVYEGADLKMADLEKKAQWKLDLLKSVVASKPAVE